MKQLFVALFVAVGAIDFARADGYPFDPDTQEVHVDSMRFRLSAEQIDSISATGIVTFSTEQLTVIRGLYPTAAAKQDVIAATFNDNNEGLDADDVHCFWVRGDEIAVTINHRVVADAAKAEKALPQPPDILPDSESVRLSPDGHIYHRGKPISLREAFHLIDAVERPKTPGEYFDFRVVVPPPYVPDKILNDGAANLKVREIFAALRHYGEAQGVPIFKTW